MIKIRIQGSTSEEVKEASELIEKQSSYEIIYQSGVLSTVDGYSRYYKIEKKDGEKMLTVEELVSSAQADVWFEVYNGQGELLFEGERKELIEVLKDKTKPAAFNPNTIIEDYWLSKSCEGVLCFHVQE